MNVNSAQINIDLHYKFVKLNSILISTNEVLKTIYKLLVPNDV